MGVINEEMLMRRAEHNEGILHSLEELVLQEEGIMDINRSLGASCPNLKILYLPNNLISRLSNLHRLKQLQYLNVAVNNILKVEGLEQCEFLEKLDMTLNFVGKKELPSVAALRANIHLRDLFLTGNPCQEVPGYRSYVIATLPSLKRLDGIEVRPSEKIRSQQEYPFVKDVFGNEDDVVDCDASAEDVDENGHVVREYTPASRVAEYVELEQKKKKDSGKVNNQNQRKVPERRTGFDPLPMEGRIYQKNEGNWSFKLAESECGTKLVLDVAIGRYMDTSAMDIDIQPLLVRVLIKGKLLQLRLPEEVKTSESIAQRSRTSGHLVVTMPKAVVKRRHQKDTYVVEATKEKKVRQKPHVKFSEIENIITPPSKPVEDPSSDVPDRPLARMRREESDEVPPLE
ncbi:protein tilB homolog isoform X2 [Selaginella moellendorffii]|uniref:protein tilB homolog isoform X2 n=1 Tax=Selaginella moellendorffii TaxID=88036 RepID=UPI000D1CC1A4|nr:protein tilB homolog isoform X2 [Selaginella moellendorffii]|eukprot:XP_024533033.1 protein tilB homolog isoform X2 [Selaginella moellendorffii]